MNWIKRLPLFETVLVTVILVIHAYAALSDAYNMPNAWFTRDDAYYYFKVAQNISEGHGVTFDGINRTNGYHPLWMLICIPIFTLARFDLILPLRVLVMVMAALNAWTAILVYRLVRGVLAQPIAMLAASFWAFNAYIHYTVYEYGLETPLAALMIVLLLYYLSKFDSEWRTGFVQPKQIAGLAVIATIMMFSRLDLVFLAMIVGLWIIFRGHPIRFLLPFDIVAIFSSMVTSFALRTGFPDYYLYVKTALLAAILALIVKITILYFLGLYQHPRTKSVYRIVINSVIAIFGSTMIIYVSLLLLAKIGKAQSFPRIALIYDFGISLVLILVLRLAALWFGNRNTDLRYLNLYSGNEPRSREEHEETFSLPLRALRSSRFHEYHPYKSSMTLSPLSPFTELKNCWKTWLKDGAIYYGILGGILTVYMLWNKLAYGTSTPVSGQIKRWWGSMLETLYDGPPQNLPAFLGIGNQWVYDVWQPVSNLFFWMAKYLRPLMPGATKMDERYYLAMIIVSVIALLIMIFNPQRVRNIFTKLSLVPLITGSGIHILSYTTTGYAGAKEWYWISQMILVVLSGSILIGLITRPILKVQAGRATIGILSGLISLYLVYFLSSQVVAKMPYHYFSPDRPYMEVLPFLEGNTPPGSVIGMTGGGNVGYFIHDRTIVNMDGLINSFDYFQALKKGEAPVYLNQKGMVIIFANAGLLNLAPYNSQFAPYLERFGEYGGKALFYLLPVPKY